MTKADGVEFDIGADGIMDQTAWVGADDGLLALDINEDGVINDHSELFGTLTVDGFTILAQHDQNGDGVIDAQDAVWQKLVVWQDVNQDGISQEDEMSLLSEFGIVAINVNADETGYYNNGQWISHDSTFIYEDGSEGEIVDAWFDYDPLANVHEVSGDGAAYTAESNETDVFLFDAIAESATTIENFDTEDGDVVDLSLLVEGQSDVGDAINDFVYLTEENGDTVVSVDVDGADGPAEAVEVAKLKGVTGATVEELVEDGNIVV